MTANKLFITPAAKRDIADIYDYGCGQWGESRASHYRAEITDALWRLRWSPEIGKRRDQYVAGVRSLTVREHLVYYRVKPGAVQVLRVLHCRQEPGYEFTS